MIVDLCFIYKSTIYEYNALIAFVLDRSFEERMLDPEDFSVHLFGLESLIASLQFFTFDATEVIGLFISLLIPFQSFVLGL